MTADAGTRADLIAELGIYAASRVGTGPELARLAAAALEEADRQLADLRLREDRTAREGAKRTHWQRERAEAAEAALKVATDALEKLAETGGWITTWHVDEAEPERGKQPTISNEAQDIAREALAAIRQEREPYSSEFPDLPLDEEDEEEPQP